MARKSANTEGSPVKDAEKKCLRLLAVRERSSGELMERLLRDGFAEELARTQVERLVNAGVVDDERFCRLYIQGKRNQGWGMQRIIYELKKMGLEADDYPELFMGYTNESDELERAEQALTRYRGRSSNGYSGRYRYLITKGFSASIVRQAMNTWREA